MKYYVDTKFITDGRMSIKDQDGESKGLVTPSLLPYILASEEIDAVVNSDPSTEPEHIFANRVEHMINTIKAHRRRLGL